MSRPESFPGRTHLTAEEFATRCAVSPEFIHGLRKAGKLPYLRDGRHGFSYPVAAGDRAIARAQVTAKTDPLYQRDRKSGKRCGLKNGKAAK